MTRLTVILSASKENTHVYCHYTQYIAHMCTQNTSVTCKYRYTAVFNVQKVWGALGFPPQTQPPTSSISDSYCILHITFPPQWCQVLYPPRHQPVTYLDCLWKKNQALYNYRCFHQLLLQVSKHSETGHDNPQHLPPQKEHWLVTSVVLLGQYHDSLSNVTYMYM